MTNDTNPSHPDIEIYVAALTQAQACTWLETKFDQVTSKKNSGKRSDYVLHQGATEIPLMVVEKATGKYTSLWFDSAATPWLTDLDCAREAHLYFKREVRCIVSGWKEGDDPDEWWSIAEQEQKISWRNA